MEIPHNDLLAAYGAVKDLAPDRNNLTRRMAFRLRMFYVEPVYALINVNDQLRLDHYGVSRKENLVQDAGDYYHILHFLRNEPSQYMFEDFQSILIFNEVKNGNNEEQHNNIKTMLMANGF